MECLSLKLGFFANACRYILVRTLFGSFGNGASTRTCQEIQCFPYAEFFLLVIVCINFR